MNVSVCNLARGFVFKPQTNVVLLNPYKEEVISDPVIAYAKRSNLLHTSHGIRSYGITSSKPSSECDCTTNEGLLLALLNE